MKLDLKVDLSDKRIIGGITAIVIVLIVLCILSKKQHPTVILQNTKKVELPKDTKNNKQSNKKMVMYGRDSCPWCSKQKKEMGDEMQHITYVNCETSPDECRKASVSALPTWVINGKKFEGFMPKDQVLAKLN